MSNMALWSSLEKTDPSHTKQFTRGGGFKGTAINATYILKRLTEAFGPCGRGWRFVLDDERIEQGHSLKNGDKARLHIVRGHIEYLSDGTWFSTSPQFGQTMLVDENKNGVFTDEEAPKKSITDCISKCAVLLGIGADVHLGLFDDNKYVNERKREEAAAANGDGHTPPPKADPRSAASQWAKAAEDAVRSCETHTELSAWEEKNEAAMVKLRGVDQAAHARLMEVIQDRYERLNPMAA